MNVRQKIWACGVTILATLLTTLLLVIPLIGSESPNYYEGMLSAVAIIILWLATFFCYVEE